MSQKFAIVGIGKGSNYPGQKLFLDLDSHSGGYPYWTTSDQRFERFDSVERALRAVDIEYMYSQASDIKVVTVEVVTTPVQDVSPNTTKLAKRITELEREIDTHNANARSALNSGNMSALELHSNKMRDAVQSLAQAKAQLNAITS